MSEADLAAALKTKPEQRQVSDGQVDLVFKLDGSPDGVALAVFDSGNLVRIDFSRGASAANELPSLAQATARGIAQGPLALQAIRHIGGGPALTLAMLAEAAGSKPMRVGWRLFRALNGSPATTTTWAWKVEGGNDALYAEETNGSLHQPIIRPLTRPEAAHP
jgi:hypothetical protein